MNILINRPQSASRTQCCFANACSRVHCAHPGLYAAVRFADYHGLMMRQVCDCPRTAATQLDEFVAKKDKPCPPSIFTAGALHVRRVASASRFAFVQSVATARW